MLTYDPERTKDIVERLVRLGNSIRLVVIGYYILVLAVLISVLSLFFVSGFWWVGTILGAIIGYGVGVFAASAVIIIIEGLAQTLVAQDTLLTK
jgi:hypothetical protein